MSVFLQHSEILNPVYFMSSDSIPVLFWRLSLSLSLSPADCSHLGFWSSGNTLTGLFEGKRDDIVLPQIHSRDMQGALAKSLSRGVCLQKAEGDTISFWKIYAVWCHWHSLLFAGTLLDTESWHICGTKPNQLWFTPHHHLEGGPAQSPCLSEDVWRGVSAASKNNHSQRHTHACADS